MNAPNAFRFHLFIAGWVGVLLATGTDAGNWYHTNRVACAVLASVLVLMNVVSSFRLIYALLQHRRKLDEEDSEKNFLLDWLKARFRSAMYLQ